MKTSPSNICTISILNNFILLIIRCKMNSLLDEIFVLFYIKEILERGI